ncbi:hypothetical protein [Spiroplasma endosymbiont of Aspidapion aeneum]|uniref:hypothetical protein n=1 Tax=Spiroplasma endosymbiont of Aspidapion aeneum TaxID=3066276 RepID=UPI00313BE31B
MKKISKIYYNELKITIKSKSVIIGFIMPIILKLFFTILFSSLYNNYGLDSGNINRSGFYYITSVILISISLTSFIGISVNRVFWNKRDGNTYKLFLNYGYSPREIFFIKLLVIVLLIVLLLFALTFIGVIFLFGWIGKDALFANRFFICDLMFYPIIILIVFLISMILMPLFSNANFFVSALSIIFILMASFSTFAFSESVSYKKQDNDIKTTSLRTFTKDDVMGQISNDEIRLQIYNELLKKENKNFLEKTKNLLNNFNSVFLSEYITDNVAEKFVGTELNSTMRRLITNYYKNEYHLLQLPTSPMNYFYKIFKNTRLPLIDKIVSIYRYENLWSYTSKNSLFVYPNLEDYNGSLEDYFHYYEKSLCYICLISYNRFENVKILDDENIDSIAVNDMSSKVDLWSWLDPLFQLNNFLYGINYSNPYLDNALTLHSPIPSHLRCYEYISTTSTDKSKNNKITISDSKNKIFIQFFVWLIILCCLIISTNFRYSKYIQQ